MSAPYAFELDEYAFTVNRLRVKESLKGLKLISAIVGPAFAAAAASAATAGEGSIGEAFSSAVAEAVQNLDTLPELLDMFAKRAKFTCPDRETPTQLEPFVEDVFGGRPDWTVAFIAQCVEGEYGSFFDERSPMRRYVGKAAALSSNSPTPK